MKDQPKALIFIFITLLIDVIGIGLIIPVVPSLIKTLLHDGDISKASVYGGWLMFAYALMQFLFSPILGALSDRFGRRPVLLLSLLGLGLDYLLHAYATSLTWLFIGRIVAGVMGASFTTATAYIADISTPEKRSQNFGLVGVAFGVGFIIGPVLGGIISSWMGAKAVFIFASILTLLNVIYGYFVLPESLSKTNRRTFEWKRANPIGTLIQLKKYPKVFSLVTSFILIYIAAHSVQSNWTFYTILKFNWSEAEIGYSLGFIGILVAIIHGGLVRVVVPTFGEVKVMMYGLVLESIGMLLFGFASVGWMMYVFCLPYTLGGISGTVMQGYISNQVPDNEQGELQGALTSLISLTSIIGPPLMNQLFAFFTSSQAPVYFPGAPFILGFILMILSIILVYKPLQNKAS